MLQSLEGDYYFFKADILGNMVTYSTDKRIAANLITISAARALEIIAMNKQGEKPATLEEGGHKEPERPIDLATQDDLNRFDKKKKKKKKNKSGEIRQQQEPVSASAQPKDANEVKDNRQPKEGNQSKENNRPPRDRNRNRRNPKGGKPQKNMPSNE
jgi:hypothetical protein